jgi:MYXO-CTERM domain-containing protein
MRVQRLFGVALGGLVFVACSSAPEGEPASTEVDRGALPALTPQGERAEQAAQAPEGPWALGERPGMVRYRGGVQAEATPQCTGPKLTYLGGPIVMAPIIVPVFWSSHVNAALTAPTTGMPQFFADITQSSDWLWLQEYDTVGLTGGTEQVILGGSATAGVTLTPSLCAGTTNCTVSDAQIQTELSNQITSGVLPVPQVDCTNNTRTIYMIEFPPNVTVNGPSGAGKSCVQFCAYHSTGTYGANKIPLLYGVLMDEFTAACKTGCGNNATPLENQTDTASHELIEATTDPDIGLLPASATMAEAPMGWYDTGNNKCGEIADICDDGGAGDTITVNGRSWVVQEVWSNKQGKCASSGTTQAVCSGTTVTGCRLCSCGDSGGACTGGTAVCETTSTNVLFGGCEQCTSKSATACTGAETCEQSTTPAQDDICSSCSPITSCPAGDNCGTISNGCGGTLSCGAACTAPQSCGGGGTPNVCGCTALTKCPAGDNCGSVSNGCGGMLSCGPACAAPDTCGGGGTANVCGCTALTKCPGGDNCGTVPDGCGGTVSCGSCTAPQTCGGGGTANQCGSTCVPITTCPTGDNCGVIGDGCGATLSCGTCGSSQSCVSNKCVANTTDAGSGNDAGSTVDSGSGSTADSGSGNAVDSGSGSTADSGSGNTVDSGSGSTADSGSGNTVDSGSGNTPDSGSGSTMDSGSAATGDAATEGDAAGDGGAGSQSGNSGGCGCRTAQAREAGPSPALLAFGALALLGGVRLRRRTRR